MWTTVQVLGIDFIWLGDDTADNQGPMFSPTVFGDLFRPYGQRVAEALRFPWAYHSDGNLMPILEDILSLGMSALHPIQPNAMDIEEPKWCYGHRVCLWGNIDLEYTLTRGSPEEVTQLVRPRIETVGQGGGYTLGSSNSIPSYCKLANVLAMAAAVRSSEAIARADGSNGSSATRFPLTSRHANTWELSCGRCRTRTTGRVWLMMIWKEGS